MKFIAKVKLVFVVCFIAIPVIAARCGCKSFTPCYTDMLEALKEQDEVQCVEDSSVGTSTITIFLHALQAFCEDVVVVNIESETYDDRNLYEVILEDNTTTKGEELRTQESKPTIIIDGGQEGGMESVRFCLFIIEQLVACQENNEMIRKAKWVFMPSTNPDGLEFSRYKRSIWRKNLKVDDDELSFGVDISRNFDEHWGSCAKNTIGFSADYPGPSPASEEETKFIKNVINKHKQNTKLYLSVRRDGHYMAYPHAYSDTAPSNKKELEAIVNEISHKVNFRSGGIHTFKNGSIYSMGFKPRCGHSVDWAYGTGIKWAFEMRVYLEQATQITSMYQNLPRNYVSTLRSGYFSGIRELYSILTNKKKLDHLLENNNKI